MQEFKKQFEKIFTAFILLSIVAIFIGSILTTYVVINLEQYSYILYMICSLSICLLFCNYLFNKNKLEICDYLIIFLIILGLISVIFSNDIRTCLVGAINRNEGFYSILSYYCLFLISTFIKNDKYRKLIIHVTLLIGLTHVIYGLLQVTDILKDLGNKYPILQIKGVHCHAKGFVGNANSFGALMLMLLCLSLGLLITSKKKILYIFSCLIFSIGLFISGTMSSVLTLIIILFLIFIYIIIFNKGYKNIGKYLKYIIVVLVCVIFSCFFVASFSKKDLLGDIKEMVIQISDVARGKVDDSYGTSRIYIWKNSIEVAPKYFLHGVGIDRFQYAFGDSPLILPSTGRYVDKAHNEYLQILITEGLFTFITYIIFIISIIRNGIKNLKSEYIGVVTPLLLCVLGYAIQAFFNISVTRVAPFFFIFMGLLYTRSDKNIKEKNKV